MHTYELTGLPPKNAPVSKKKFLPLTGYLSSIALITVLRAQDAVENKMIRHNDVSPLVLIVSIFVLLAMGGAIILGAMALCLGYGRNFEAALRLNPFEIKVICK